MREGVVGSLIPHTPLIKLTVLSVLNFHIADAGYHITAPPDKFVKKLIGLQQVCQNKYQQGEANQADGEPGFIANLLNDAGHAGKLTAKSRIDGAFLPTFEPVQLLKDLRFVVVGDLMLDRYLYGRAERISPEAPVPILLLEREEAGWVAPPMSLSTSEALGCQVELCGAIGTDPTGKTLQKKPTARALACMAW